MLLLGNKYPWWCQALPLVRNQMVSRLTWWCHNCYDRKHQLSGTAARILLLIVLYQLCMVHIPSIKQPAGICIFPELGSLAAYLLCQSWPFDQDYYANSTSISLRHPLQSYFFSNSAYDIGREVTLEGWSPCTKGSGNRTLPTQAEKSVSEC